MDDFREWLSDNLRYFMLGGAILIIVVVLFCGIRACSGSNKGNSGDEQKTTSEDQGNVPSSPISEGESDEKKEDANPMETADADVTALISEGNWMINNGALQDSEISAYMEKQLSDSDVSALIKKVQNELDQAQQSDPSLEEFLNGLGEEAGVSTEAEDGTMLTASEECNVRAEASTDADILGVISAGDLVQKTGTDGEWVQIDYDGQTGYIRGDLLE